MDPIVESSLKFMELIDSIEIEQYENVDMAEELINIAELQDNTQEMEVPLSKETKSVIKYLFLLFYYLMSNDFKFFMYNNNIHVAGNYTNRINGGYILQDKTFKVKVPNTAHAMEKLGPYSLC